ncbi:mesothelin-like protein [Lampris incognitus]|uniref:mesothelin-like protein n=1 Tax=Lampris incognitus TaxID=2546036 RepID=UPI0024B48CFC|nr:mesothelin-like protein [Lampris incognitus]
MEALSPYILQGFTCTRVRTLSREKIKNLVKACRGKRRRTVILQETQLTCMYNYIKAEPDVTNYNIYPPDMLLYYDYSLVPQANCTSYFQEIADADFSVFSDALSYRIPILFTNARSCLGITGVELTEGNISVLGNMCCTLNGSYIQNSHSSILEKLKNCPDIDDAQVAAMESLLMTGTTRYGAPSTWDIQTLKDLGILPLYLTKSFYKHFDKKAKQKFLRYFLKKLRRDGVKKKKIRRMKKAIRQSKGKLSKRSIENECTVGQITQVTISDEAFPFDYDDINQFNICLSNKTVKDNLAAITDKVDDEDYLGIILKKLREAYAASSTIPEEKVHILGPASRVATNEDISMWKITKTDTLSALMDSSNGEWDPAMANTIITKYLSEEGNSIGSAELNLIGGANLCSLDADVLKKISQDSLRKAKALTVSNCTLEKKKVLFTIAIAAFSGNTRSADTITSYQLIKPYLGGAPVSYVRSLASSDVSMDMATFIRLDESIIMALSVDEVRGLLGTNLPTLKSYENQIVVQNWICNQYQSDLDSLALGLVACRADPTSTTGSTGTGSTGTGSTVTTVSAQVTTAGSGISSTTGGSATTTGSGSTCIRPDIGLSLLVLLTCYITSKYFSQQ